MRLDHIAFRVKDREQTSKFFEKAFGYKVQADFSLVLEDGSTASCFAMEPPEKKMAGLEFVTGICLGPLANEEIEYHLAPELFVSSGPESSVVGQWVASRGGIGGIHHLAYQVDDVAQKMETWKTMGINFTTQAPLTCPDLTQVFSHPLALTGIIYEFIERKGKHGFCSENVAKLMSSTKGL